VGGNKGVFKGGGIFFLGGGREISDFVLLVDLVVLRFVE